jgi:hypothetical protein
MGTREVVPQRRWFIIEKSKEVTAGESNRRIEG